MEYTSDDYQNLITYKLFNQHIRPLLLEKNPKLVMYKLVSIVGAKWREFIELKEQHNASKSVSEPTTTSKANTANNTESSNSSTTSSHSTNSTKEAKASKETKEEVVAKQTVLEDENNSNSRRRGTRKRGSGVDYNEADETAPVASTTAADEAAIAAAAAELEEESYSTRRSARQKKPQTGGAATASTGASSTNGKAKSGDSEPASSPKSPAVPVANTRKSTAGASEKANQ
jgi:chromodomain-helicase-DNA-binding protein 4